MLGVCELTSAGPDAVADLGIETSTALLGEVVGPALGLLIQAGVGGRRSARGIGRLGRDGTA